MSWGDIKVGNDNERTKTFHGHAPLAVIHLLQRAVYHGEAVLAHSALWEMALFGRRLPVPGARTMWKWLLDQLELSAVQDVVSVQATTQVHRLIQPLRKAKSLEDWMIGNLTRAVSTLLAAPRLRVLDPLCALFRLPMTRDEPPRDWSQLEDSLRPQFAGLLDMRRIAQPPTRTKTWPTKWQNRSFRSDMWCETKYFQTQLRHGELKGESGLLLRVTDMALGTRRGGEDVVDVLYWAGLVLSWPALDWKHARAARIELLWRCVKLAFHRLPKHDPTLQSMLTDLHQMGQSTDSLLPLYHALMGGIDDAQARVPAREWDAKQKLEAHASLPEWPIPTIQPSPPQPQPAALLPAVYTDYAEALAALEAARSMVALNALALDIEAELMPDDPPTKKPRTEKNQ